MKFLELIGLAPSQRDKELRQLVAASYPSVSVVGRGTVRIDPKDVSQSAEFHEARRMAETIVNS